MALRCLIIDDEPLARECLRNYCREVDFLEVAGIGKNPIELTSLLETQVVDLIFLDIQMPTMSGMEFLRQAKAPPMVVITTAFPSYAIESFQLDVLDYLLKPITFNRFYQAATRALRLHRLGATPNRSASTSEPGLADASLAPENEPVLDHFFVKCEQKFEKIYFADILYVKALQNYVTIYTDKGKYLTLLSLKKVMEHLGRPAFLRVHKSYLVSVNKIDALAQYELSIGAHRVPVSRTFREEVIQSVVADKLWKK